MSIVFDRMHVVLHLLFTKPLTADMLIHRGVEGAELSLLLDRMEGEQLIRSFPQQGEIFWTLTRTGRAIVHGLQVPY